MTREIETEYARIIHGLWTLSMECFRHPTEDFVARVGNGSVGEAFKQALGAAAGEGALDAAVSGMREAVGAFPSPAEARLGLEVDYCALFVGPGRLIAPPYESVYRGIRNFCDVSGKVGGAAIDPVYVTELKKEYLANGFAVRESYTDFQDHIALELEYMAFLYERAASAFASGDAESAESALAESSAFAGRLAKWLPMLRARMEGRSSTGFYESALDLVLLLVGLEAAE